MAISEAWLDAAVAAGFAHLEGSLAATHHRQCRGEVPDPIQNRSIVRVWLPEQNLGAENLRGASGIGSWYRLMRIVREESNWGVLLRAGGGHASLERLALRCGYRVGEVCDALGCCERYLYEVFVRDLGMPPKLWMRGERMAVARRKLTDGAAPADVAAELGFQGLQHFRREFRETFGVTPAEFQRHPLVPSARGIRKSL